MKTISIRVEPVKGGIRAWINTSYDGVIYASQIKNPYSTEPYYILDGKRHELTDKQRSTLAALLRGEA